MKATDRGTLVHLFLELYPLDKELNFTKLNNTIDNIVKDTETLKTMGESAKKLARADVEENIYKEICRIVSKHETRNNLPPE